MIKLIVSDMDGTLIGEHMSISQGNKSAIDYALNKGVPFAIATGRHLKEALPVLQKTGISCPLITANGAAIYNTAGTLTNVFAIPKKTVAHILETARQYDDDLLVELSTVETMVTDNPEKSFKMLERFVRAHLPESDEETILQTLKIEKEHLTTEVVPSLEQLVEQSDDATVLKFFITEMTNTNALAAFKKQLLHLDNIVITSSHPTNIEINAIDATKGNAVAALAQSLTIPMDNVMALGDNFNDVSMLSRVGYGIAMANADDAVKNVARYVTSSNLEDGVAKAIYDFI